MSNALPRRPVAAATRLAGIAILAASSAWPQDNLSDATLEELLNTKVISVSKKEEDLSKTAAAVFIIRREDIRRSGATNIPELLRLAPGVEVARVDGSTWAVSIRGFNGVYSNKVLVLIDGRSVYTSVFSGVFWDQVDLPLEEIERIEVIRGPGASVWGANAVNGVINIITKSSENTHGGTLNVEGGSQEHAANALEYGDSIGRNGNYRAFAKYTDVGDSTLPGGAPGSGADAWHRLQGGFRSDWRLSDRDWLTVEGDVFDNAGSQARRDALVPTPSFHIFPQATEADGGSLLARWTHNFAGGSNQSLQVYYNTFHRLYLGVPIGERSFDIDYQNHRRLGARQDIVWGLECRRTDTVLGSADWIAFTPRYSSDNLYSAFLQDEIRLSGKLTLTIGSKFEHNSYTGFAFEPGARLAWMPASHSTLWASASRAIRQPDREQMSVAANLGWAPLDEQTSGLVTLYGNPKLRTEEVRDYEVGYRRQVGKTLSVDVAAFLSFYRHLTSIKPLLPTLALAAPNPYLELPEMFQNNARAVDYGGEIALNWNPTGWWRISPAYSLLRLNQRPDRGSPDALAFAGDSPEHIYQTRSLINLTRWWSFDQTVSWTSGLAAAGLAAAVPSYWRLDLRLARRLGEAAELSVVGQDLLASGTMEFTDGEGIVGTEVRRSVYGRITWRF